MRDPASRQPTNAVAPPTKSRTPTSTGSSSSGCSSSASSPANVRQQLPWHLVPSAPGIALGKPRALAPTHRSPNVCNPAFLNEIESTARVLPWDINQTVLLLVKGFIAQERESVRCIDVPWRPLRDPHKAASVAVLPPLCAKDMGGVQRPSSFEAMVRLQFQCMETVSNAWMPAILSMAAPLIRDAEAKHKLLIELAWAAKTPSRPVQQRLGHGTMPSSPLGAKHEAASILPPSSSTLMKDFDDFTASCHAYYAARTCPRRTTQTSQLQMSSPLRWSLVNTKVTPGATFRRELALY